MIIRSRVIRGVSRFEMEVILTFEDLAIENGSAVSDDLTLFGLGNRVRVLQNNANTALRLFWLGCTSQSTRR